MSYAPGRRCRLCNFPTAPAYPPSTYPTASLFGLGRWTRRTERGRFQMEEVMDSKMVVRLCMLGCASLVLLNSSASARGRGVVCIGPAVGVGWYDPVLGRSSDRRS